MPAAPFSAPALVPGTSPGPLVLFLAFLGVAVQSFGGVLPFARRMLVDRRGWLSAAEFDETLALCQSLPGPNIVNLSTVVGWRFAGAGGAAAAVLGLMGAPVAIVLVLAELYGRYGAVGRAPAAIGGLGAAAAGLVAATAARMALPLMRRRPVTASLFIAAAFALIGVARLPLIWVMPVLAPLAVAVAWRRRT